MGRFEDNQTHNWDDDNPETYGRGGYLNIQTGDTFKDARYVAQKKLGWGNFSTVWLAWDTLLSQYVTLKVQMSDPYCTQQAKAEIATLQKVASRDQENQRCVVKLLDHFIHSTRYRNFPHVCMVFEYLGDNLIKLIICYGRKGLPLRLVKKICLQILDGLDYLHTEFSLIHGDIKPENILLLSTIDPSVDPVKTGLSPILPPKMAVTPHSTQKINDEETPKISEAFTISLGQLVLDHDVESQPERKSHDLMDNPEARKEEILECVDHRCKLIDFGHVCSGEGYNHSLQTLPYRSPEVILGDGNHLKQTFSTSADIWSFACVCFELATGQYLFPSTYDDDDDYCQDEDHLALMKQQLDRIPPAMIARARPSIRNWFDNKGRLRRVPTRYRRTIKERLVEDCNFNEQDATELGDFLTWILKYEPAERPTAAKCRRHRWFNDVKDDHFVSGSKESGHSEKKESKNVNVVEDDHLVSKSKENGESTSKNKKVSRVERLKKAKAKAMMEATGVKTTRRGRRLNPSIYI